MSLSEEPTSSQSNESISVDGEYIESIQKKNVERHETAVQEGISSSKSSISESNQQRSPARVNWLSPPRSKVSDRIKAFSSPSRGANVWKNSPSRLSTVPGRWGSGNSNVSNGSSEKIHQTIMTMTLYLLPPQSVFIRTHLPVWVHIHQHQIHTIVRL